jgi:hypothetical protein
MHVGAKVGHFQILGVAGRGGMGEVWKAFETKLRAVMLDPNSAWAWPAGWLENYSENPTRALENFGRSAEAEPARSDEFQ